MKAKTQLPQEHSRRRAHDICSTQLTRTFEIASIAAFGYGMEQAEQFEDFGKTRFLDGLSEITYGLEAPASEDEHVLYVDGHHHFRKEDFGRLGFVGRREGGHEARQGTGVEARGIKDVYKFGDTSEFYLLEKGGNPVGNMFFARKG